MPRAFACHFAGEVKGFDVEDYIPGKEARHMDTFIHYGVAAAMQAVKDAGLKTDDQLSEEEGDRIGVPDRLGHRRPAARSKTRKTELRERAARAASRRSSCRPRSST